MLEKRNIDCMDSEWLSRAEWTQWIWRKLDEHLPVHIFGKWGNFTCPAPPDENFSTEEGAKGLWKYKFFLTFESSLFKDYITEKNWGFGLQNGLGLLSLAVQTTKKLAIPGSFIDVQNFQTVEQWAKYIDYLDNNDTV